MCSLRYTAKLSCITLFCSLFNGLSIFFDWLFSMVEDKGDGIDEKTELSEDLLIHEEIYQSRLAKIKQVGCYFFYYSTSCLFSNVGTIFSKKKLFCERGTAMN